MPIKRPEPPGGGKGAARVPELDGPPKREDIGGDAFEGTTVDGAGVRPQDSGALARSAARFSETSLIRFAESKKEFIGLAARINSRIDKWQDRYGSESIAKHQGIYKRLQGLRIQYDNAISLGADRDYLEDVLDAARILWNRVLKVERELFTDRSGGRAYKVDLYDYADEEAPAKRRRGKGARRRPRMSRDKAKVKKATGEVIEALRSERKGGMGIALRPNQWEMAGGIQDDWAEHEAHLDRSWKEAVVVAPTGSGKTHVMGATIELGIREDWLDFERGDKAIILTHLKQISRQNIKQMRQLLNPIFREVYGRNVKITFVGGGGWNASGDVVVASVPTLTRSPKRVTELFKGTRHVLVLKDEYHHASAESWQKSEEAVQAAVGRGYAVGFTATLPPKERPLSNIVSEHTIREMMQIGVLPPVDLVQVRTGVSLERIPTSYGTFNLSELSKSVRNPERYEHMMRALEFGGVRNGKGGIAPTLAFTVDRAHAHEMAFYYQDYFSKVRESYSAEDGSKIKPLGVRNIAVIKEDASAEEVKRLVAARRGKEPVEYEGYAYGSQRNDNGAQGYHSTGLVRGRVDGIVAVLTAKTPDDVRKKILDASRRGEIECVVNIRALGEGFDGYWIQNLVGASPNLVSDNTKMVQRAQEVGRILRWGSDEVDESGILKREPRERVVIDLVDDTSQKRPLTRYFDMLGLGDAHERGYGVRIDVKEGMAKAATYGGLMDVFERDDEGYRKKVRPIKPEELTAIEGDRLHQLLPEDVVGALAMELRGILKAHYGGDLASMAFDVGLMEEALVGYLNGAFPNGDRLVKRLATLLYRDRLELMGSYFNEALDWKPLEEVPEEARDLVRAARDRAMELFGGRVPRKSFTTVDGWKSKQNNTVLTRFLRDGAIEYSNRITPHALVHDLEMTLLRLERTDDGEYFHSPRTPEFLAYMLDLMRTFIEKQEGWNPIEEIPEEARDLVSAVRDKAMELFGGRLPISGFTTVDGWKGRMRNKTLAGFLSDGAIEYSTTVPPHAFVHNLEMMFMRLERNEDGGYLHSPRTPEFLAYMLDLMRPLIEKQEGWKPIEEIPEVARGLVSATRDKAMELFGGWVPSQSITTADGWKSKTRNKHLTRFLRDGAKGSTRITPRALVHDLEMMLLRLERTDDGGYLHSPKTPEYRSEMLELLRPFVEKEEGWKPIEEIPEEARELVSAARDKAMELFGGRLPRGGFTTADGWKGKQNNKTLIRFLSDGAIEYSNRITPHALVHDLEMTLMRLECADDGEYSHRPRTPEFSEYMLKLLRPFIEKQEGWKPIEEIPEVARGLVSATRDKAMELFGGRVPRTGFQTVDGWKSKHENITLTRFLRDGVIEYSTNVTPHNLVHNLEMMFMRLERTDDGGYLHSPKTPEYRSRMLELLRPFVEKEEGWKPIEEIPEAARGLVHATRDKAMELFGGRMLTQSITTVDGWKSKQNNTVLTRFLRDGAIEYSTNVTPHNLVHDLEMMLMRLERNEDGGYLHSPRTPEFLAYMLDLMRPFIEKEEGWKPIEEIPEGLRGLVGATRDKAMELFGGRLPTKSIATVDGWKSGQLDRRSITYSNLLKFMSDGYVEYNSSNRPTVFWRKCREVFFGIERMADGKYSRVDVPQSMKAAIERQRSIGEEVWQRATGAGKKVLHPGAASVALGGGGKLKGPLFAPHQHHTLNMHSAQHFIFRGTMPMQALAHTIKLPL